MDTSFIDKERLQQRIVSALSTDSATPVSTVDSVKSFATQPVNEPIFLYALAVCLLVCIATFIAIRSKPSKPEFAQVSQASSSQPDIQPWMTDVNRQLAGIRRDMKIWSDRQWALGIASNENTYINQLIANKIDPRLAKQYIQLDRSWKLNKSPVYLEMTDDDRKLMIQSMR